MEHFLSEVTSYCAKAGIRPEMLLRRAVNAKWSQWASWCARDSSPRMETVQRVRDWMAANPPRSDAKEVA